MKLALLTNYTSNWIKKDLLKQIPDCESVETYEYNELMYQLSDLESDLHKSPPNYLIISMLWEEVESNFLTQSGKFSVKQVQDVVAAALSNYQAAVTFAKHHGINLIMFTYPSCGFDHFYTFDENSTFGNYSMILDVNRSLMDYVHDNESVFLINTDRLIAQTGLEQFFDYVKWYAIKQPFKKTSASQLLINFQRSQFFLFRKIFLN